jgi:hypothetical protein
MNIDAALRLLAHTPCVSTQRSRAANWQTASLRREFQRTPRLQSGAAGAWDEADAQLLLEEYVSNRLHYWNVMMLTKVRSDLDRTLFARSPLESFALKNKYDLPLYLDDAGRS